MHLYQFTLEQLETECNNVRRILIDKMYKQGLISEETYREYMLDYAFIIRKPSMFNSFWNGVLKQEDKTSYILVKQESFVDDMNDNPPDDKKKPELKVIDLDKHKK